MKIKLKSDVIHSPNHGAGKHLKKGEVHDLPDALAGNLIERKLAAAVEDKAEPEETEEADSAPVQNRKALFKQYAKASKEDLLGIKAEVEKALAENPDRADAKTALEVVTELLKKK